MFNFKIKSSLRNLRRWCSTLPSLTIKETLNLMPIDKRVIVQGWVQSVREYKDLFFVDLVDGTCLDRLQVVIQNKYFSPEYGSSIKVEGCIVKSSHKGQEIELLSDSWNIIGSCPNDYPFEYHKKYSSEYIRQFVHLRPRTRYFSSIMRVRNHASMAVHKFFQDEEFCFVHTPVITQNDCEGAGEVFAVEPKAEPLTFEIKEPGTEKGHSTNEKSSLTTTSDEASKYFFKAPTYLTVSGQLHLEAMACALRNVYNFSPTFRADSSTTRLHASEFQMIEAEMAFIQSIDDLLKVVEKSIKFITKSLVESCSKELNFLGKELKNHDAHIDKIVSKPFVRISYDEAAEILKKKGKSLAVSFQKGEDFSTEHKQYLVKHCGNSLVFITMFPSDIKPFYMKSDENKKAYCFDLFAPYGGEVCGGSLREDSADKLKEKYSFKQDDTLLWYLDLRKYGTVPHGGFGIGFDRLLQSILGISNIRDVIPFPRRKYDCKC